MAAASEAPPATAVNPSNVGTDPKAITEGGEPLKPEAAAKDGSLHERLARLEASNEQWKKEREAAARRDGAVVTVAPWANSTQLAVASDAKVVQLEEKLEEALADNAKAQDHVTRLEVALQHSRLKLSRLRADARRKSSKGRWNNISEFIQSPEGK
jgi:hypothetical protein